MWRGVLGGLGAGDEIGDWGGEGGGRRGRVVFRTTLLYLCFCGGFGML